MVTAFASEVTKASAEFHKYLDQAATAPAHSEDWVYMHSNLRADAQATINSINQDVLSQLKANFRIGRLLLEGKEKYTRRKAFAEFREKQFITPAEGRKAMNLYQQFGGWVEEKLLIINSVVNLSTLCHPKFAAVVQQLGEMPSLTKEFVKNLIKEVRDAARAERRRKLAEGVLPRQTSLKKPLTDSCSGWRRDPSGGGRHYQLPPMYNEEAAMKVEALATERGVRAIIVVEEAIVAYSETALKTGFPSQATANPKGEQPTVNELRRQHQEEMQAAVTEMRDEHIRMQRKIIELKHSAQTPVSVAVDNFSNWIEFADTVVYERTTLLNTVKPSLQERQSLSVLLANYLSEDQNNLDQVAWVPEKLLHSALSKLSFTVSNFRSGPNNMIDEPEIEEINGCRFVSVNHLGTQRREQWMFEGYRGRKLSVFGRDEFRIEEKLWLKKNYKA